MQTAWRYGLAVAGAAALIVGLTAQARPRPEVSLLGVRVFTPISQVVRLFGNPTMVTNTQVTIQDLTESGQQGGGQSSGGFGQGGDRDGMPGPSGAPPGFGQPPGNFGGQNDSRVVNEIVYVYRVKGGSTYVFQFNKDGRVVQISAYGRRPDSKARTSRGIRLGDPYSKIIELYQQPDEHAFSDDVFVARYNKLGVAFQIEAKTNRVTGIIVAAGIPSLGAGFTGLGGGSTGGGPQMPSGGIGGAPRGGGRAPSGGGGASPAF